MWCHFGIANIKASTTHLDVKKMTSLFFLDTIERVMKLPSLKNRKPKVYIFLAIFALLSTFIIVESCLDSSLSGWQSELFARISAIFINNATGPQATKVHKPLSIEKKSDSSRLGQNEEGNSKIAIGTTTLLQLEVTYPEKDNKDDEYDKNYVITDISGNKNDYNLVLDSSLNLTKYTLNIRIVANNLTNDLYQFNVTVADTKTYEYKFHIVDLEAPTQYEAKLEKTNLKIGETTTINAKITREGNTDAYWKRYYDISKISRSSDDPSIATIDEYGVIHALSTGSTTINYGTYHFNVSVNDQSITKPVTNSITLNSSKEAVSLLDYDYVYEENEDKDTYSALIYSNFADTSLEDQSVSWSISDNLKAKLGPYKYDEDGYPLYHDDDNKPCVRVSGYRKDGNVTLTCLSNVDNNIKQTLNINVTGATATDMSVNIADNFEFIMGAQKVIKGTFTPKNTYNTKINVTCNDAEAIKITNNNSSSVTITALKVGNFTLTIKSLSNESLTKTISFKITAKQTINENNFADFHQFMRKFAGHGSLFLLTAIFGFLFFYSYFENEKEKHMFGLTASLLIGFLVAGLSELIQYFVPTRYGSWKDIGIDFLGYVLGTLITLGIYLIVYFIKKRKRKEK